MLSHIDLPDRDFPLIIPWPVAGNAGAFIQFDASGQWRAFIDQLSLDPRIPDIVRLKFERAQKLYLLGWIDADLIKAGELVALTTLELALNDRYGTVVPAIRRKKIGPASTQAMMAPPPRRAFKALLTYMVTGDGLTDADIPMVARCGGSVVGPLGWTVSPTLDERRNALAHGDPFDGFMTGGLLELVRDLIMFAYRAYLRDMNTAGRV